MLIFRYEKKDVNVSEVEEDIREKDKEVGLDKFLSKYTSEDNDSFETIMKRYSIRRLRFC